MRVRNHPADAWLPGEREHRAAELRAAAAAHDCAARARQLATYAARLRSAVNDLSTLLDDVHATDPDTAARSAADANTRRALRDGAIDAGTQIAAAQTLFSTAAAHADAVAPALACHGPADRLRTIAAKLDDPKTTLRAPRGDRERG